MLRRGFTLIELMVVLTVGTVIVGIGVGTLHVLLRTEQTGRGRRAPGRRSGPTGAVPQRRQCGRATDGRRTQSGVAVRPDGRSPRGIPGVAGLVRGTRGGKLARQEVAASPVSVRPRPRLRAKPGRPWSARSSSCYTCRTFTGAGHRRVGERIAASRVVVGEQV